MTQSEFGIVARPSLTQRIEATVAQWVRTDGFKLIAAFIVAHVLVWTVVPAISRSSGALWDDMLETYAWAREWQLGYYKHPPFYAWVVGAWFFVFPRTDSAYYLLSAVNVGVGLFGIWALSGRLVKVEARLLSVLLLTFMPYYNYMASNFNANTILLSVWPWTAYAFVRSMEERSLRCAIAFGALAAAGMLAKYYAVLMLASCFVASLVHPQARQYYRSASPYVTVAVAAVLVAPHAWWSIVNDFPTIRYALGKTGQAWSYNFHKAVTTAIASVAMNIVAAAILVAAVRWRRPALFGGLWNRLFARDHWWILILGCGPFVLTILLGAAGYVKVAVNFLIPAFYMLPLMIMLALEPAINRDAVRGVLRGAVVVLAGAVIVAPAVAFACFHWQIKGTVDVSPEAARDAARRWHESLGVPLRIVSGSEKYSLAQPFYGPDRPAEFTHFNFFEAPWISRDRILREGLLSICQAGDTYCLGHARTYAHAGTIEVEAALRRKFYGMVGPAHDLIYVMTPPR